MKPREKIIRNSSYKTMNENAEIVDHSIVELKYIFKFSGEYSNGGTTPSGPVYNSFTNMWSVDLETARNLITNDINLEEWVNENHMEYAEEKEKYLFIDYRDITGKIYLQPTIEYTISYFGSDTVIKGYRSYIINKEKSNRLFQNTITNAYDPILVKDELKITTEDQSKIVIQSKESSKRTIFNKNINTIKSMDFPYPSLLLEYLQNPNEWVQATIGSIKNSDDQITIELVLNDVHEEVIFKSPFTDNNEIYTLLDLYEYTDPIQLENEPIYISFSNYPLNDNTESISNFIKIRPERKVKNSAIRTLFNRILS